MKLDDFLAALEKDALPPDLTAELLALWHAGKGRWDHAHGIVQDLETPEAAWVHAYLHRVEGDPSNARYWYSRAGKKFPAISEEKEYREITRDLLELASR